MDVYIEEPVASWGIILDEADFPSIRTGMCGFFATALTIFFPPDTVDLLVNYLFDLFSEYDPKLITVAYCERTKLITMAYSLKIMNLLMVRLA